MLSVLFATILLTNAQELTRATLMSVGRARFDLEGSVLRVDANSLKLTDGSGSADINLLTVTNRPARLDGGDRIRIRGVTTPYDRGIVMADGHDLIRLSSGIAAAPVPAKLAELNDGLVDGKTVRTVGTVREVFRDEIEPTYIYFLLADDKQTVYVTYRPDDARFAADFKALTGLTDAKVSVLGTCLPCNRGYRRMIGRTLAITGTESVRVLQPPPADPFSVPLIDDLPHFAPSEILSMGRRRTSGTVIAVCHDQRFYIKGHDDEVRKIKPAEGPLPRCGDTVEVSGLPETDLYRINLSDARWRPAAARNDVRKAPALKTPDDLLLSADGLPKINTVFHGRPVKLRGQVLSLPPGEPAPGILYLQCGAFTIPIDSAATMAATKDVCVGCEVEVCGTCIVETENWSPFSRFPHATGISIVLRSPEDIRILAYPPWWTFRRLMIVIGSLLAALLGILIWNRGLSRLVERRSRELLKEQIARVGADLRVGERTRLAVELHDSLSQNLAGLACQIVAAKNAVGTAAATAQLETAERMLLSSRTELKRCLWDLRGDTLDNQDLSDAIAKTVKPVLGDTELSVRFNVPRTLLLDSTAHSILCIVRELAANAVHHGRAKHVRIAGECHDGSLSFSVRDDGTGFAPDKVKGPAEGHFGLEGIRERVDRLGGAFILESSPQRGTRAEVSIRLPLS